MAVTEILGTDSLSSSRVTLNNNFLDVQDEIQDLQALLNPSTNQLVVNEITTGNITINPAMGTGITSLLETTTASLEVDGEINLKQLIKKTGIDGVAGTGGGSTTLPTTLAHSTYFVDCTNTLSLSNVVATDGTEITLICTNLGQVDTGTNLIAGASQIDMEENSTLTLRYINSVWYIVSSFKCVII